MARLEHVTVFDIGEYAQEVGHIGYNDYDGYGNGEPEFDGSDCWDVKYKGKTWNEWDSAALEAIVNDDRKALTEAIEGMDRTYWLMRCPKEKE